MGARAHVCVCACVRVLFLHSMHIIFPTKFIASWRCFQAIHTPFCLQACRLLPDCCSLHHAGEVVRVHRPDATLDGRGTAGQWGVLCGRGLPRHLRFHQLAKLLRRWVPLKQQQHPSTPFVSLFLPPCICLFIEHRGLGSATLSQLVFPGESNPNFLREKSQ